MPSPINSLAYTGTRGWPERVENDLLCTQHLVIFHKETLESVLVWQNRILAHSGTPLVIRLMMLIYHGSMSRL